MLEWMKSCSSQLEKFSSDLSSAVCLQRAAIYPHG